MANQMIALQARAPQAPGLGSAIQQNAQVINMLAQQRVAERQAAQAQQKMALEAELAAPQLAKAKSEAFSAEQKALTDFFDVAAKVIGLSKSPEDVQFGANMLKQRFDNPLFTQMIDQTIKDMPADPQAFGAWRNRTKLETLDAKDQVPYFFEQVKSKELIGESGDVGVLTFGGAEGGPTIKIPRTLVPAPARTGTVNVEPSVSVDGGMGGPASVDAVADLAGGIASARNDREYQDALALLGQTNPDVAASVRRAMPRFDPARIEGIRAEFSRAFGSQAGAPLVAGDRGGMGGPFEGYTEAPRPFRARVPAPPVGPQPRETAEEVYQKEAARLRAQREAGPKPLTAPQEMKLRDNIAKDYKSARSTIEMMDGVSRAVNEVRNLSPDQKEAITGFSGYAPSILPSSRSADTKLKNLQGKVTEMGKAAASLTGAIGQMAVQEWRIVSDMIASLDVTGMEPADLDNQLDIIEGQAKRAASITRDAYENQYVEDFARYPGRFQLPEAGGTASQGAPKAGQKYPVLTPDQVRKAPKGTTFRTTDGRLMRKN